jgi:hemerythrin superfamily protein
MEQIMATQKSKKSETHKDGIDSAKVSVKRFDGRTVKQPEAIAFLMRQHRAVEDLFDEYEDAEDDAEKGELTQKICLMLAVHAKIEEELLYPAAKEEIEEPDLVDEAAVEHATAKDLIAQIETMHVGDSLYDAKVKVLSEYIAHHVEEEESELFPQLKRTDVDLAAMGKQLEARAEELEEELSAGGNERASRKLVAAESRAGAHI